MSHRLASLGAGEVVASRATWRRRSRGTSAGVGLLAGDQGQCFTAAALNVGQEKISPHAVRQVRCELSGRYQSRAGARLLACPGRAREWCAAPSAGCW